MGKNSIFSSFLINYCEKLLLTMSVCSCLYDRYSSKILSFGIVDLGLFPNAAEKFGISLSGTDIYIYSHLKFVFLISFFKVISFYFTTPSSFSYCNGNTTYMKSFEFQEAWASFQHLSYLTMQLKLLAFQSWIFKQHFFTLQLQRYLS